MGLALIWLGYSLWSDQRSTKVAARDAAHAAVFAAAPTATLSDEARLDRVR
jgi:hypothetical protein